jgi:CubicO group peptidase (beta-lactamase class C family)
MNPSLEQNWEQLKIFVAETLEQTGVPGAAVGVLYQGQVRAAGFGVTNVDHPLPVTEGTLFQIGSITKTFTGTLIMMLAEAGELELDAPVRAYIPDFRVEDEEVSRQVTIRHLLTHTSGWVGDVFDDTGAGDDALARYAANMADTPQLAPMDRVWSYNNAGFSIAGYVIERVTGQSYQTVLQERLLDPLGMDHAYIQPTDVMTHRFAVGHQVGENGAQVARPWPLPRAVWPAGGIVTSAPELLRYARFHLQNGVTEEGERLLSEEGVARMQEPQVTVWEDEAWGISWALKRVDGAREVSHGGGTVGQIAMLLLMPAHDFALALLTNADRGGRMKIAVRKWALAHFLGLTVKEPTPQGAGEEELRAYVGRYARPFAELELGMLGGKLVGQMVPKEGFPTKDTPPPPAPPPLTLDLCEPDRLLALDGPFKDATGDVIRNPDGSIGWLRFGGRVHRREE